MTIQYLSSIFFLVVLRRSCSFNRDGHQSIWSIKGFTLCFSARWLSPSTPILPRRIPRLILSLLRMKDCLPPQN